MNVSGYFYRIKCTYFGCAFVRQFWWASVRLLNMEANLTNIQMGFSVYMLSFIFIFYFILVIYYRRIFPISLTFSMKRLSDWLPSLASVQTPLKSTHICFGQIIRQCSSRCSSVYFYNRWFPPNIPKHPIKRHTCKIGANYFTIRVHYHHIRIQDPSWIHVVEEHRTIE